eukprot:3528883-Pleurochrysis_carterae.AAC.1
MRKRRHRATQAKTGGAVLGRGSVKSLAAGAAALTLTKRAAACCLRDAARRHEHSTERGAWLTLQTKGGNGLELSGCCGGESDWCVVEWNKLQEAKEVSGWVCGGGLVEGGASC